MTRTGVAALAAAAVAGTAAAGLSAYADGPPPAHTGGFGEPTCRECHFGGPEDPAGVRLDVKGLPARYRPGRRYGLTVVLEAPELRRGGFELSTRFLADDRAARQAGSLAAEGGRVEVVSARPSGHATSDSVSRSVSYARQTREGSLAADGSMPADGGVGRGRLTWALTWTAPAPCPDAGCAAVALDVAANASNDDASEFGDRIVVRRLVVPGPRVPAAERNRRRPTDVSFRETDASSPPP